MAGFDRAAVLALEFIDAFNERDRERFLSTLAPAVELHPRRAVYRGRSEAALWFERPLDHLTMRMQPARVAVGDGWAIVAAVVRLSWKDGGALAEETSSVESFLIGSAGILRWQPFDALGPALAAVGFDPQAVAG